MNSLLQNFSKWKRQFSSTGEDSFFVNLIRFAPKYGRLCFMILSLYRISVPAFGYSIPLETHCRQLLLVASAVCVCLPRAAPIFSFPTPVSFFQFQHSAMNGRTWRAFLYLLAPRTWAQSKQIFVRNCLCVKWSICVRSFRRWQCERWALLLVTVCLVSNAKIGSLRLQSTYTVHCGQQCTAIVHNICIFRFLFTQIRMRFLCGNGLLNSLTDYR